MSEQRSRARVFVLVLGVVVTACTHSAETLPCPATATRLADFSPARRGLSRQYFTPAVMAPEQATAYDARSASNAWDSAARGLLRLGEEPMRADDTDELYRIKRTVWDDVVISVRKTPRGVEAIVKRSTSCGNHYFAFIGTRVSLRTQDWDDWTRCLDTAGFWTAPSYLGGGERRVTTDGKTVVLQSFDGEGILYEARTQHGSHTVLTESANESTAVSALASCTHRLMSVLQVPLDSGGS